MQSAKRFPVLVYDRDAREAYKSGGLAAKARDVADAGRFDDTHIIHVTDDELNMLRQQWGDPTINPHTGMPEFGLFGSLFKAFKKIAPIAVSFIPGIGPVAGAALGAGMGALDGGGLKGALLGGVTGALGAGGASGIGSKLGADIGGKILGQTASGVAKNALGQALIQGALSTAAGGNPLTGLITGGAMGALRPYKAAGIPAGTGTVPASNAAQSQIAAADAAQRNIGGGGFADFASKTAPSTTFNQAFSPSYMASLTDKVGAQALPTAVANTTQQVPAGTAKPNFWNRDFLGLGVKNKYAVPAAVALLALGSKQPKDEAVPSQEQFFGDKFGGSMGAPGNFKLASVSSGLAPEGPAAEYAKRYLSEYATGGNVGKGRSANTRAFAVEGAGTGRSDEIPAMLSDGEYVMDAETVALLGDGSTKAGAKALDDFRVKIRKHKGQKLAKGKFSVNAKKPEAYMRGGRL